MKKEVTGTVTTEEIGDTDKNVSVVGGVEPRTCGQCIHFTGTRCGKRSELQFLLPSARYAEDCPHFQPRNPPGEAAQAEAPPGDGDDRVVGTADEVLRGSLLRKTEEKQPNESEGGAPDVLVFARFYVSKGLSVIPIKWGDKTPILPSWKPYQGRLPTEEELREWFSGGESNVAIVTGRVSGNLVVIDFDSKEEYEKWLSQLPSHLARAVGWTWVVETGKGVHVYFRLKEAGLVPRTKPRVAGRPVDIKGEGGYVLAPPSLHPSGKRYTFLVDCKAADILTLGREDWEGFLATLGLAGEEGRPRPAAPAPRRVRVGEEAAKIIANALVPAYIEGHRNNIVYALLGTLIKSGVDREDARRIVSLLVTISGDDEAERRIQMVDYHYDRRVEAVGVENLKGVSGLREELEAAFKEQGLPEDEAERRASEAVATVLAALGARGGMRTAWLKRSGGLVLEWVAAGRQGIYLYKRGRDEESAPVVQIVSNAVIRKAKAIRILGLDLRNLYMVDVDGEMVSGTVDDIVGYIEKHYGLEPRARFATARLIDASVDEEEEVFYSPGPWVVDGHIVFARDPGYTPDWKPYFIWKPPDPSAVGEEEKRAALEAIKKLVGAYGSPAKASLVLSYAALAPVMHYVKKELNIAPHLIIHGRESTGKSLLLETIRLLYNMTREEQFPGTDFQTRVLLSASTLPAIVDEIGPLIEGYVKQRKGAIEALDVLHRAATQEVLRVSGGYTYGGYFLAIRTVIGATNGDVSAVPWQLDKYIIIEISTADRVDIEKARGATPRTMPPEVKAAVPAIGVELLKEVEALLPTLEEMKKLPRGEIRDGLIKLGYEAWRRLYAKYGLEPFPPPAEPETQLEIASVEEQYKEVFLSYVERRIAGEEKGLPQISIYDRYDSSDIEEQLRKNLAVVVKNGDRRELVCKPSFLTEFMSWAEREFNLPHLGWRRLAEILGLRETMRKLGDKTIGHLLVGYLD